MGILESASLVISVTTCEHPAVVKVVENTYFVRVFGVEKSTGTWEGWLEFHPTEESKPVLLTGTETTQTNRLAIRLLGYGAGTGLPRRGARPPHSADGLIRSMAVQLAIECNAIVCRACAH